MAERTDPESKVVGRAWATVAIVLLEVAEALELEEREAA